MHFLKKLQNKIKKKVSKFDSYRTLICLKGITENTSDRIHFLMTSCINEQAECWSKTECTSVALHIHVQHRNTVFVSTLDLNNYPRHMIRTAFLLKQKKKTIQSCPIHFWIQTSFKQKTKRISCYDRAPLALQSPESRSCNSSSSSLSISSVLRSDLASIVLFSFSFITSCLFLSTSTRR